MIHFLLGLPNIDTVVSLVSLAVYVFLILKSRWGYVLGFINQGIWTIFMYQTHKFGLKWSIAAFALTNIVGLIQWTRNPPVRRKRDLPHYCDRCATVLANQTEVEAT